MGAPRPPFKPGAGKPFQQANATNAKGAPRQGVRPGAPKAAMVCLEMTREDFERADAQGYLELGIEAHGNEDDDQAAYQTIPTAEVCKMEAEDGDEQDGYTVYCLGSAQPENWAPQE